MKRTLFSIFLFLTILIISFHSQKLIEKCFSQIISKCNQIETTFLTLNPKENAQDREIICEEALELYNYINSNYNKLALFLSHDILDFFKNDTSSLIQYTKAKETGECLKFLNSLKSYAQTIINLQKITPENIF